MIFLWLPIVISRGRIADDLRHRVGRTADNEGKLGFFFLLFPASQVHFQPITPAQTLVSRIPSGRAALAPKPFSLPPPTFRPSAGGPPYPPPPPHKIPPPPPSAAEGTYPGGNGGGGEGDDSSDDEDGMDGAELGDYFGAGQYF